MSEEDQVEAMNDLWRNFCVSDAYEPGSTAKPFTVAAGLETGTLTGNESYYCGGSKDVLGTKISCHYKSGHGQETIQDAIANSSGRGGNVRTALYGGYDGRDRSGYQFIRTEF